MSASTRDEVMRHLKAVAEIQPPVQQTITAVADYVRNLIAGSTANNTQPLDINGLTLAADDRAEPAAVN